MFEQSIQSKVGVSLVAEMLHSLVQFNVPKKQNTTVVTSQLATPFLMEIKVKSTLQENSVLQAKERSFLAECLT